MNGLAAWNDQHARIIAKLIGFTDPGAWRGNMMIGMSISARYARAVAAYQQSRIEKALGLIDGLIADEPDNPYFYELKGQMPVDFARVGDGIAAYRKSLALKPDASLIRMALGHAVLSAAKTDAQIEEAIELLQRARAKEFAPLFAPPARHRPWAVGSGGCKRSIWPKRRFYNAIMVWRGATPLPRSKLCPKTAAKPLERRIL